MKRAKSIRLVLSLIILFLTAFLFVDFARWLAGWEQSVFYLQFAPSLVRFVHVASLIATGFIVVLIFSFLFGRLYCSGICPLGTLQDIFIWLSRKLGIRKRLEYHEQKTANWSRYIILSLTVITFLSGSIVLVNLLDPFANFGRIIGNLLRPLYFWGNNQLAIILEGYDIYTLYPVKIPAYNLVQFIFPFSFFLLLISLSLFRGRFFCNYVCPVGAVLSLVSRRSVVQFQINQEACTLCGACAKTCKAECIDFRNKDIDTGRCVACFNCIGSCKEGGITYARAPKAETVNETDGAGRRAFLSWTATAVATGIGLKKLMAKAPENVSNKALKKPDRKHPVTPPGSQSMAHLTGSCIACHMCVSACPTGVLQPSVMEYGLEGILQPRMDYFAAFCNYECTACTEVCPSGALTQLNKEAKKKLQIGQSFFIKENCVVYTDETDCGACDEHCPTEAIKMVHYKDDLKIPEVDNTYCVGCGACEFACPTKPHKAIYVDGNPLHKSAKAPEIKNIKQKEDVPEEFPF